MLGTHFESCRGQMSHICDISPLKMFIYKRVAVVFVWNSKDSKFVCSNTCKPHLLTIPIYDCIILLILINP